MCAFPVPMLSLKLNEVSRNWNWSNIQSWVLIYLNIYMAWRVISFLFYFYIISISWDVTLPMLAGMLWIVDTALPCLQLLGCTTPLHWKQCSAKFGCWLCHCRAHSELTHLQPNPVPCCSCVKSHAFITCHGRQQY